MEISETGSGGEGRAAGMIRSKSEIRLNMHNYGRGAELSSIPSLTRSRSGSD